MQYLSSFLYLNAICKSFFNFDFIAEDEWVLTNSPSITQQFKALLNIENPYWTLTETSWDQLGPKVQPHTASPLPCSPIHDETVHPHCLPHPLQPLHPIIPQPHPLPQFRHPLNSILMDAPTDGWMVGWMDHRTNRPSYRDTRTPLKIFLMPVCKRVCHSILSAVLGKSSHLYMKVGLSVAWSANSSVPKYITHSLQLCKNAILN